MRICIMQPYFLPYPGYYLLHKNVDLFVILDDVEFNRRGFVHRNKVEINNKISWLTLPLKKKSRGVFINDLEFDLKGYQIEKFLKKLEFFFRDDAISFLKKDLSNFKLKPIEYLFNLNNTITNKINVTKKTIYSSTIPVKNQKGENRIINICKYLNAREYVNLPGGKLFYNSENFVKNDIKLKFLNEYTGDKISILNYIKNDPNFKL